MKLYRAKMEVTAYVCIHEDESRDLKEILKDAIKDEIEFNNFTDDNSLLLVKEIRSKDDFLPMEKRHLSAYPWEVKIEDEDLTVEQILDKYSNQVQPQPPNA